MEENFSAKRHDASTIKNNTDDLSKLKVKIDEPNAKVTEDNNALFDLNGRYIRSGHKFRISVEFEIDQRDCRRNHGAVGEGSRQSNVNFAIETGKRAKMEVANAKAEPPQEREKEKTVP